ncbi:hypothetical protein C0995_003000, partial [Termitomyces sp. Mi166
KSIPGEPSKTTPPDNFLSSEKPSLNKKAQSNAHASSSKLKKCVDVSSGEESDTPFNYKSILASPTKSSRLAAWHNAPGGTYVSVSDSDDDARKSKLRLGFNDSFMYDSDNPFDSPSGCSSLKPKQPRKKHASVSSSSDSGKATRNRLHKSPRKSKEHKSPRKGGAVTKANLGRPSSPSPAKVTQGITKSVIDISDSDDELPSWPVSRFQLEPPLMRARARAEGKIGGKQTSLDDFGKRAEKPRPAKANLGCIDLT